jgi:3-oxoacyl-[acyl-carrier-protein] synthase III
MSIKIIGVGSFIPTRTVTNLEFAQHQFYTEKGEVFPQNNEVIAKKFKEITGISERRYANEAHQTSDLALLAAQKAIEHAGIDPETIDYIILAHNFGDVKYGAVQSDILPSLASRVKHQLKIKNNRCVAYDILFGCPGWLEGMIQAYAFIKAGIAKTCLIIGAEMLSRVVDHHDRDSMIFADGAGASILSISDETGGILAHQTASHTFEEA